MQQKRPAKMGREVPHFVDEAVLPHFVLFWGNSWWLTLSVQNNNVTGVFEKNDGRQFFRPIFPKIGKPRKSISID